MRLCLGGECMRIRLHVLKNIRKYISKIKGSIIGLILISLMTVPISLIYPKFFQILIDDVMWEKKIGRLGTVIIGLIAVFILRFICDGISLNLSNRVLNTFSYNIRKDVFTKYNRAPYYLIEKMEIGDLKMRFIDDVDSLGNFIKEQVINYISTVLIVIITLYMSFYISKTMTLYCLLIVPFVFLINYLISVGTKKINAKIRNLNSKYYTSTHNTLQFWREIKAQNSEVTFIERFKEYRNILARLGFKSIRYWAYSEVFNDFKANYLTKVFVYIIGTFFVMKQEISVGILIMFSEYFAMLVSALDGLNSKRIALNTNSPYYERIFETFTFPEESTDKLQISDLSNGIIIRSLNFSYMDEHPVLTNVNLEIKKGDYIAIVGKTGCGKTTLVKLIMGFYPADKGQILIDGVCIEQIRKSSLYDLIGMVMQDNFLFNMSIRENLLLANESATESELVAACKKANIYDFVVSLPNGFDTEIGECGVKLSGGQKQRISIAAALLRKPSVLIFDEATSSLDKPSEDVINDAINEISKDITVIVITHKPATALRAKKVVVMENGKISAVGTHEQLMNKNKFYTTLAEASNNE